MNGWRSKVRGTLSHGRAGAGVAVLCAVLAFAAAAQDAANPQHHPAPIERRPPTNGDQHTSAQQGQPPQNQPNYQSSRRPQQNHKPEATDQRHLGEWLEQHQGLSLMQQQQALDREPGFTKLQPQVQQRMNQRLEQLNTMPPARRNRAIERIEAMERLSPGQRQQVRGAMQQLGGLPLERRRAVAQSFHILQQMPLQQRQQYLNSPQIRSQFSPQEIDTLGNLVRVAPFLPLQPAGPER